MSTSTAIPKHSRLSWKATSPAQDREEWDKGSIEDWVLEGYRLAQAVACGDLGSQDPAPISAAYEQQADPVIELLLEKAGVRLAFLLNDTLRWRSLI